MRAGLTILLVLLACCTVGQPSAQSPTWEPPIGIPRPDFGIDEIAPGATSTLSTLPATLTLVPGQVVEIADGAYAGSMTITGRCTAAEPCFVRGASAAQRPHINGRWTIKNASYVIVENVQFEGVSCLAVAIYGASDHVVVRDARLQNLPHPGSGGCTGVSILPDLGKRITEVVILRTALINLGMNRSTWDTIDQDFHGVTPSLWGRNATSELDHVWILDSECADVSGNCVQVNAGNWTNSYQYLHHVYIGRNVSHDMRQAGFWSKQARDVIISENTVYHGRIYGSQGGDGIGFQYGPDNLWILFNRIYDTAFGIRQTDTAAGNETHRAYIIGNVISNSYQDPVKGVHWGSPSGWGISLWQGGMFRFVLDNTIYRVHGGIEAIQNGPLELSGNIIAERLPPTAGLAAGHHVAVAHPARNGIASIDRALFYQPDGPARIAWNFVTNRTLAQLQAMNQCASCFEGDPLFVDAPTDNFTLSAGSPARGLGMRHPAYDEFLARYGLDIAVSADGLPRPPGSTWDLGSYAYNPTCRP